jgi:hypothetical protein
MYLNEYRNRHGSLDETQLPSDAVRSNDRYMRHGTARRKQMRGRRGKAGSLGRATASAPIIIMSLPGCTQVRTEDYNATTASPSSTSTLHDGSELTSHSLTSAPGVAPSSSSSPACVVNPVIALSPHLADCELAGEFVLFSHKRAICTRASSRLVRLPRSLSALCPFLALFSLSELTLTPHRLS